MSDTDLREIRERVRALELHSEQRDAAFARFTRQLAEMDTEYRERFARIESRLDRIEERLGRIEAMLATILAKIG